MSPLLAGEVALGVSHIADVSEANGNVAGKPRIGRVGLGQALSDQKALFIGAQRGCHIALNSAHISNS